MSTASPAPSYAQASNNTLLSLSNGFIRNSHPNVKFIVVSQQNISEEYFLLVLQIRCLFLPLPSYFMSTWISRHVLQRLYPDKNPSMEEKRKEWSLSPTWGRDLGIWVLLEEGKLLFINDVPHLVYWAQSMGGSVPKSRWSTQTELCGF